MKILDYDFPDNTKNSFLLSLHKQFQDKGALSEKQTKIISTISLEYSQCFRLHEEFPQHKYEALSEIEIENLKDDFDELKQKVIKNRFMKLQKRNECIDAFESILNGKPYYHIIDDILRPAHYHRRFY
jgi:uncharacterized CHY-type Zn-finger protein